MLKKNNMFGLFTNILLSATLMVSCNSDKPRVLPDNPDVPFVRYATDLKMQSTILNTSIFYSVFLPADYTQNTDKRYPVVYLLHGLGDDHKSWNDKYLQVSSIIQNMETTQGLEPMIYVMPQGFRSYYVNRFDGSYNYTDMFVNELVPFVDAAYRTLANREHRAVVGYSMGGFGAMILPSKHPEIFSVSVPLSMSFRTDEQYTTEPANGWDEQWGRIFGGRGTAGAARLTDYYKAHCPFYMFNAQSLVQYAGVKYFLDCGDDEEQLLVANDNLHTQLRELGMPHEFRVRNGGHESSYWRSAMTEALPYIVTCFQSTNYKESETVSVPSNYTAVKEEQTLAQVPATVYLPQEYAAQSAKRYSVLYYLHNGDEKLPAETVMKVLDNPQKPFIMIACNAQQIVSVGADFNAVMLAAESQYRTQADSLHRTALGYDAGGKMLYEASLATTPFVSLFLLDADLGLSLAQPNSSVFYYIAIADEGTHYKDANALYKRCRELNVPFEYRVYNGTTSYQSMIYGLDKMKSAIQDKIIDN
jgi:enterochelin esterase-like enzyme